MSKFFLTYLFEVFSSFVSHVSLVDNLRFTSSSTIPNLGLWFPSFPSLNAANFRAGECKKFQFLRISKIHLNPFNLKSNYLMCFLVKRCNLLLWGCWRKGGYCKFWMAPVLMSVILAGAMPLSHCTNRCHTKHFLEKMFKL